MDACALKPSPPPPHRPRRLNEASGATTAADCSGYGRDAAYTGGVTVAALSRNTASTYYPAAAVAPYFDGASGYVALPTILASTAGGPFGAAFTVEMWVRYDRFPIYPGSPDTAGFLYEFSDTMSGANAIDAYLYASGAASAEPYAQVRPRGRGPRAPRITAAGDHFLSAG